MKWKEMFRSLLQQQQKNAPVFQIAKHLAKVALYEEKGGQTMYPDLYIAIMSLEERMAKLDMPVKVHSMFRSFKEQDNLYAKGRTNGDNIVTNARAGQSYHNYGLACDVIFRDYDWTPPSNSWWQILGQEGKALGLEWGGDWKFKDYAHFEYHPGFTWRDLRSHFIRE